MAEKTNGNAAKGGITKMGAVREAMSVLGKEAARTDIFKFVKEKHGLEMNLDHISSCKGEIQREKKAKKPAAAKHPAAKHPEAKKELPKPVAPRSISLEDIESVKNLVERVGPDSLRKLIAMLAK